MSEQGGFHIDETAPITPTFPPTFPPAFPPATVPTEVAEGPDSSATPVAPVAPLVAPSSTVPAVVPPAAPSVTTPAGWFHVNGEQRYWDGSRWTEHRAPAAVPAYHPSHYYAPVVITDARTNGAEVAIAWILTVLTLGYMLPWAVAATRGKSNSGAVGLVNFLLGWTFIGWLAALVMACTAHQVAYVHHRS